MCERAVNTFMCINVFIITIKHFLTADLKPHFFPPITDNDLSEITASTNLVVPRWQYFSCRFVCHLTVAVKTVVLLHLVVKQEIVTF